MSRRSWSVSISYSQMFHFGWSSSSSAKSSSTGPRIAKSTLRPSAEISTPCTSPIRSVNRSVTLRSGAVGDARSRT
jgi:hypothetical protein